MCGLARRDLGFRPMSTASTTPGADRLAATTTRLAGQGTGIDAADVGLLAAAGGEGILWQHEGFGLAGRGVALRIELPRGLTDTAAVAGVAGSLGVIRRGDDMTGLGTGAVALGTLPFVRDAPGALVVPRVVIGRRDGEAWITTMPALATARPPRAWRRRWPLMPSAGSPIPGHRRASSP